MSSTHVRYAYGFEESAHCGMHALDCGKSIFGWVEWDGVGWRRQRHASDTQTPRPCSRAKCINHNRWARVRTDWTWPRGWEEEATGWLGLIEVHNVWSAIDFGGNYGDVVYEVKATSSDKDWNLAFRMSTCASVTNAHCFSDACQHDYNIGMTWAGEQNVLLSVRKTGGSPWPPLTDCALGTMNVTHFCTIATHARVFTVYICIVSEKQTAVWSDPVCHD